MNAYINDYVDVYFVKKVRDREFCCLHSSFLCLWFILHSILQFLSVFLFEFAFQVGLNASIVVTHPLFFLFLLVLLQCI